MAARTTDPPYPQRISIRNVEQSIPYLHSVDHATIIDFAIETSLIKFNMTVLSAEKRRRPALPRSKK